MAKNPVPTDERRKNPRVAAMCRCWLERESVTLLGTVTNISPDGVFLRTPVMLARGSDVALTLNLKEGRVVARGRVVWTNGCSKQSTSPGLGISFHRVLGGKELLEGYIRQNMDGF